MSAKGFCEYESFKRGIKEQDKFLQFISTLKVNNNNIINNNNNHYSSYNNVVSSRNGSTTSGFDQLEALCALLDERQNRMGDLLATATTDPPPASMENTSPPAMMIDGTSKDLESSRSMLARRHSLATTKERRPRFCQSDDFVGQMPTETKKDNLEVAEWEVRKALAGLGTTNIEEIRKLMPDDFNKKLQQWETKKQASCGPSLAEVGSKSSRSPKSQNKKSGNDAMKRNTVDSDGDGDLPWIERELRKIQREQENLDLDRAKAPKIEIRWKSGGQLFHQNSGGSRGIQSHSRFSVDNGGVVLENLCHLPIRLQTSEHSTSIEVLLAQEESPNEVYILFSNQQYHTGMGDLDDGELPWRTCDIVPGWINKHLPSLRRLPRQASSDDLSTPNSGRSRSSSIISSDFIPEECEDDRSNGDVTCGSGGPSYMNMPSKTDVDIEKVCQLVQDLKEQDLFHHRQRIVEKTKRPLLLKNGYFFTNARIFFVPYHTYSN
ncbi:hypothetical protein TCAL_15427 [Tigriopus californicus]|uniref:Uncharacterized protein n=1 Tax=Tigriopus californicus TaxID=6832 RepID=A0A553PTX5_TIGCA|nr:hypothetical protein TCAL_15427 [Tigriopus californicus]